MILIAHGILIFMILLKHLVLKGIVSPVPLSVSTIPSIESDNKNIFPQWILFELTHEEFAAYLYNSKFECNIIYTESTEKINTLQQQ